MNKMNQKSATTKLSLSKRFRLFQPFQMPPHKSVPFALSYALEIPCRGGVYLIADLRGVLYVGRTDDLRRRFKQHFHGTSDNPYLWQATQYPVGHLRLLWSECYGDRQVELEKILIREFQPPCNRHLYQN